MDSFVLQDWITIRGGTSTTVTQGEASWLDLGPYEDVVFWLQVTNVTGSPTLLYQTSPTADDAFFAVQTGGMTGTGIALASATSVVVTPVLAWSATYPLARYVRWQIQPPATLYDVTMRIFVTAVAPVQ